MRRARWLVVWRLDVLAATVGLLAAMVMLSAGSATSGTSTKFYSASIAPTSAAAGSSTTLTITIRNCGSGSPAPCTPSTVSTQSLGSANITFPAGFTIVSVVSQTPPAGKTWSPPVIPGNTIQLRNPGPSNTQALSPGESIAVTLGVQVPTTVGSYCLTTRAKQSNDFSGSPGNDFTRVGSEPCVTVVPGPFDHFVLALDPPSPESAGHAFTLGATAYDAFGNQKTDYAGPATVSGDLSSSVSGCVSGVPFPGGGSPCPPSYGSFGAWPNGSAQAGVTAYKAETGRHLTATDTGTGKSTTIALDVNPGDLDHFTLSTIANQIAGSIFGTSATAFDAFGNVKDDFTGPGASVSIAIGNNPGGATLFGTTTVDAVSGVAAFGPLVLDKAGSGYTLVASSGTASGTSNAFDVTGFASLCTGSSGVCESATGDVNNPTAQDNSAFDVSVPVTTCSDTTSCFLSLDEQTGAFCGSDFNQPCSGNVLFFQPPANASGAMITSILAWDKTVAKGTGVANFRLFKKLANGTVTEIFDCPNPTPTLADLPCIIERHRTGVGDLVMTVGLKPGDPAIGKSP